MSTGTHHAPHHSAPHAGGHDAPRRRGFFMRPGLVRAAWVAALFFFVGMYIVVGLRWLAGWDPVYDWTIITVVGGLTTGPIGFLLGLGAFDYWLHYISGRPTQPEDHSGHGAHSWKDYFRVNTDHKVIGVQYAVTTFVFLAIGGLMAMLFRAELAKPGLQFMSGQDFNGFVSVHATLLIFLFMVPVFAGLGNFVIPLMIGAPDMAFPRLNALSFWLLPIGGLMFLASFLAPGGAFGAGWTGYAPLATETPMGNLFFNMGVQWAGASSILTALNFLVTIISMRAPGMTFWRMPLLVWANFTTSMLVVLATPFIAGSQFFVMFDRIMNTSFFVPDNGGYVLGYQHIFWFYSHPAVYIMILPGFGIISEVLAVMSRKPVFGYRLMAISLLGILVLGFSVWAHHLFVAGMADWLRTPMMISTLLIAVPTGVKVFSWLATLWEGRLRLNTPMLFALGFISTFVIGGLSGIYLGSVAIDIHASDTYFVVAHIHYVFFGGSLMTVFAGVYYWFPKMTGRMYNEALGKAHFWATFIALNATFFPMHWVGLQGMPRRVFDYEERFANINMFITIASFVLGASVLVFFYNMIVSWARGEPAGDNPWNALTIEWQVSSPPPVFNFDRVPTVVGGPYEYGVPGARHAIMGPAAAPTPQEVHA
ncbi:MAG: cbb3-type cytochrome c oxidase subunit I [Gaiella sp.]